MSLTGCSEALESSYGQTQLQRMLQAQSPQLYCSSSGSDRPWRRSRRWTVSGLASWTNSMSLMSSTPVVQKLTIASPRQLTIHRTQHASRQPGMQEQLTMPEARLIVNWQHRRQMQQPAQPGNTGWTSTSPEHARGCSGRTYHGGCEACRRAASKRLCPLPNRAVVTNTVA